MIKLEVEKYCQECSCFEAETNSFSYTWNMKAHTEYTITCKRKDMCKNIKEYLKEQEKKKNDNTRNA